MTTYLFKGDKQTIEESLQAFVDKTGVDELIIASHIFDHDKKKKSLDIIASIAYKVAAER